MESIETMPVQSDAAANRLAAQRLMKAMRERDYLTVADALAPDVVISSPITASFQFRGSTDAVAVLKIVAEALEDLEHHDLVGAGDVWTQRFRARVRGRVLEGIEQMRFDDTAHLRELTVFVRPLPALAAFAAALAPAVGRRRGRLTSVVLRMLIEPLAAMTKYGDRLVGWLLRETWGVGGSG